MSGLLAPESSRDDPLVDAFIDSYVEWREECEGVRDAYSRWTAAGPDARDRRLAAATYRAALDREEAAARAHEQDAARLARRHRRRHMRVPRLPAWSVHGIHSAQGSGSIP